MTRYSIEAGEGLSRQWSQALEQVGAAVTAAARRPMTMTASQPYDPLALFRTMAEFATSFRPEQLLQVQIEAAREWGKFWADAWVPKAAPKEEKLRDRRFAHAEWEEQPYFRTIRDAYLLASKQLRGAVKATDGDGPNAAMMNFLVDQYLNAVAPTNFAMTNPEVVQRTIETGGANLAAGFANLVEDVAAGKGIVRRRVSDDFVVGETLATTPGSVVFQTELFQLIQYDLTTPEVAAEPLVYVPPLVNKYYMIDLQPKSSLVKWLVDQGRTVFVISWVNPDKRHRDMGVEQYVLDGIVAAIGAAREASGAEKVDLFSFCLGGTLVAIALAWLTAQGRADEVNTATLIGSMVDFADMRDWSAFVHEAHLDALEDHLAKRGFINSTELQQLFAAVRSNDLIWSSVVNHYLLDKPAPASDLLHWFEDGARIPAAFLKSYNRGLLASNALREDVDFAIRGVQIDLSTVQTPLTVIALKDDHVSAWEAVYDGIKLFGGPVTYILGGSGHNAGVINPPAANKHGYWTNDARPVTAQEWLESATRHDGSWWPHWNAWLTDHQSGTVKARQPKDAIEPAPGSYVKITH